MTTTYFRKTATGLLPDDAMSAEIYNRVPVGEVVRVELKRARNLQHHRLFFAILAKVLPNTNYPSIEALLDVVKLGCGHYETLVLPNGKAWFKPKSIDFASTDQDEFKTFFDQAIEVICTKIIPGLGRDELIAEISEMAA